MVSFVFRLSKKIPKDAACKNLVFLHVLFFEKEGKTSEMNYRALFSTRKQTYMRSLELFLTMFNLAKSLSVIIALTPSINNNNSIYLDEGA